MIFEFHILTTSYHFGHPVLLFVHKLYNYCRTALEESWISGTVLLTQLTLISPTKMYLSEVTMLPGVRCIYYT